jgi:hypothetical protein
MPVDADPDREDELAPLACARCGTALASGSGDFYRVTIEAVADPTPPNLPHMDPADIRQRIERLLAQMRGLSEQEALDQVYRRLTFDLCVPCYRQWITNPAGRG